MNMMLCMKMEFPPGTKPEGTNSKAFLCDRVTIDARMLNGTRKRLSFEATHGWSSIDGARNRCETFTCFQTLPEQNEQGFDINNIDHIISVPEIWLTAEAMPEKVWSVFLCEEHNHEKTKISKVEKIKIPAEMAMAAIRIMDPKRIEIFRKIEQREIKLQREKKKIFAPVLPQKPVNSFSVRISNCLDCGKCYTDAIPTADSFEHESGAYCAMTEDKSTGSFGKNGKHRLICSDEWDLRPYAGIPDWCPKLTE